jgi:hypothetical protein
MGARSTESNSAERARTHLDELLAERDLALHSVLARNEAYMGDLEADIAACEAVWVAAAVTEIAVRRSARQGRLYG